MKIYPFAIFRDIHAFMPRSWNCINERIANNVKNFNDRPFRPRITLFAFLDLLGQVF